MDPFYGTKICKFLGILREQNLSIDQVYPALLIRAHISHLYRHSSAILLKAGTNTSCKIHPELLNVSQK